MIPLSYNVRSLLARKRTTVAAAAGVALVVFVLAGVLMFSHGMRATLRSSARSDVALVLGRGSTRELRSEIEIERVKAMLDAPQTSRDASGAARAVAEVLVGVHAVTTNAASSSIVQVRGVPDGALAFRGMRLVEGREPHAGTAEAVVGKGIRGRVAGTQLGDEFELPNRRTVTIVGVFEDRGSVFESELWTDIGVLQTAVGMEGVVSSVRVRLTSPDDIRSFEAFLRTRGMSDLVVMAERRYYERQAGGMNLLVEAISLLIAVLTGLAAMLGVATTMHSALSRRRREIGTLRALGFTRSAVLVSMLAESVLLTVAGGIVGALASVPVGALRISLMDYTTGSQTVFPLRPTPQIIAISLAAAVLIGTLAGLVPALRAARATPLQHLRD